MDSYGPASASPYENLCEADKIDGGTGWKRIRIIKIYLLSHWIS